MEKAIGRLEAFIEGFKAKFAPLSRRIEGISSNLQDLAISNDEYRQELYAERNRIVELAVQYAVLQNRIEEQNERNLEIEVMQDPEEPCIDEMAALLEERAYDETEENSMLEQQVSEAELAMDKKREVLERLEGEDHHDAKKSLRELESKLTELQNNLEEENAAEELTRLPPDSFAEMLSVITENASAELAGAEVTPSLLYK